MLVCMLPMDCRAILESPLFQQPADSSLAPNCPAVQQQINEQLLQFKAAASEVGVKLCTLSGLPRAAHCIQLGEAASKHVARVAANVSHFHGPRTAVAATVVARGLQAERSAGH